MREYGQIQTNFWTHPDITDLSDQAKLLFLYVITGPHTNGIGCFYLPDGYIMADLNWSKENCFETLSELFRKGLMRRCETTKWVFVPNFLRWNRISNDNVAKGRRKEADYVPKNFTYYNELIVCLLKNTKPFQNRFETLSKPYRNREPDPEPDPEPEPYIKTHKTTMSIKENSDAESCEPDEPEANGLVAKKNGKEKNKKQRVSTSLVEQIFEDWKYLTANPGARLGKKRPEIIREAVRMGYTAEQMHQAFLGCARSAFHQGFNEQQKKFTDIELILRNEKNIDRFIAYASNPPKPGWKAEDNTPLALRRQATEFYEAACKDAQCGLDITGTGTTIDAESWETLQPKLAH